LEKKEKSKKLEKETLREEKNASSASAKRSDGETKEEKAKKYFSTCYKYLYVYITCFLIMPRVGLLCHDHVLKFLSNDFSDVRCGMCFLWQCNIPMIIRRCVNYVISSLVDKL